MEKPGRKRADKRDPENEPEYLILSEMPSVSIKRNILLNPGPATTSDSVKNAMVVPDICPREKEFGYLMDGIRKDLVKVVHGGDDYIAVLFASSGTGAVEAALTSAIPPGKKVLIVDNGAYGSRMHAIARAFHIEVVLYKIAYGDYPVVDDIRKLILEQEGISHVAMVHHETTTGMLNPVGEISAMAHQLGLEMIVDTISSYAGLPIRVKDYNLEFMVSTSNKCIQGMPGLSFVILKKEILAKLEPNRRSFYFDIYSQHTCFEKTLQTQFTPPVQVVYALRQALNEYFTETEEGRSKRYFENWKLLYDGMCAIGFKPLLPPEQESHILTAFCEPPSPAYDFEKMHDYLFERGFTIYPGKGARRETFRLSVLGDLYKEDMVNFLSAMESYVKENGIRFNYPQ
jgi:2-aminoethylphosphonate aminotransferase